MSKPEDALVAIDPTDLETVAGGAARVTARASGGDAELTAMLTAIGSSIKDLAASKSSSGQDPMQMMMMMMMMMGGMGGGGGGAVAAAAPAAPPVINVSATVAGGGRGRGKKGW